MKRIYMALLALALAPACSDDNAAGSAPTVTIDEQGLSPSTFSMPAYGTFWFVNDDSVPHQLHSHDCAELSTRIVMPGEEIEAFVATIGRGKTAELRPASGEGVVARLLERVAALAEHARAEGEGVSRPRAAAKRSASGPSAGGAS